MSSREPSVILLHSAATRPPKAAAVLAAEAAVAPDPGPVLLKAWRERSLADLRAVYVHGERHDLWWEFALVHSLEASAQDWDLSPSLCGWRMHWLVGDLSLGPLLHRRVLDLTPSQRALANLAAALLRRPNVLLWDDPFVVMEAEDRLMAAGLVDSLVHSEGLIVLAAASVPGGLATLAQGRDELQPRELAAAPAGWRAPGHLHAL